MSLIVTAQELALLVFVPHEEEQMPITRSDVDDLESDGRPAAGKPDHELTEVHVDRRRTEGRSVRS